MVGHLEEESREREFQQRCSPPDPRWPRWRSMPWPRIT